ncbi:hypothetical protein Plhal710r2_c036g0129251 [Plasmopara halstedii]
MYSCHDLMILLGQQYRATHPPCKEVKLCESAIGKKFSRESRDHGYSKDVNVIYSGISPH